VTNWGRGVSLLYKAFALASWLLSKQWDGGGALGIRKIQKWLEFHHIDCLLYQLFLARIAAVVSIASASGRVMS
jgi:hypothetical protein